MAILIGIFIVTAWFFMLYLNTTNTSESYSRRFAEKPGAAGHTPAETPQTQPAEISGSDSTDSSTVGDNHDAETEVEAETQAEADNHTQQEQELTAFTLAHGLRWSKTRGGKIAFPSTYRYRPDPDSDSVKLALGKRLYGRYHDHLIDIAEVIWKHPSSSELQGLCASMIDHAMPDFELTRTPADTDTQPTDRVDYPGLAAGWQLLSDQAAEVQSQLQAEKVAYWVEQGLQVQSIGGQLLITLPNHPPEHVAELTVSNVQCLLQALPTAGTSAQ